MRFITTLIALMFCVLIQAQELDSLDNLRAGWVGNRKGYTFWWFTRHADYPPNYFDTIKYFNYGFIGYDTTTVKMYKSFGFAELFRRTHKKKIRAHFLKDVSEAKRMHAVYVNKTGGVDLAKLEEVCKGKPILIVGENYAYKEAMINFLRVGKIERYTLNEEKLASSKIVPSGRLKFLAVKTRKEWDNAQGLLDEVLAEGKDRIVLNKKELEVIANEYKQKQAEIAVQTKRLDSLKKEISQQRKSLELSRKKLKEETKRNKKQLAELEAQRDAQERRLNETKALLAAESEHLDQMKAEFAIAQQVQDSLLAKKKEEIALNEEEIKKQNAILSQKEAMIKEQKGTIAGQKNLIYIGVVFSLAIILIAFLIWRNYRQKKLVNLQLEEKNTLIQKQKVLVEEKNREIVDSIQYAKRLQDAILPAPKLVRQWLSESFILFKPKDIVAGDFYWMDSMGDEVIFAAADCTGHGVPGAMVSVVCANALRNSVRELGIADPGAVLDHTREQVIAQFDQSEADVKDGMDVALCTLNTRTREFKFAGANNPLWVISKASNYKEFVEAVGKRASYLDAETGEDIRLVEIKGDKQPIGVFDDKKPFQTVSMHLEEGDIIYVFSDGFADQFGGPKGKKLKYKPFKQLLMNNHSKPMAEQRDIIDHAFEDWRGDHEQIDDVCVIGVRV